MSLTKVILNFLLPPRCPVCHEKLLDEFSLCGKCFAQLKFINNRVCAICGKEIPSGQLCGECIKKPPHFHRCRSVLKYNLTSKALILPFKHTDHQELTPLFVRWMSLKGKELLNDSDIIIPIPLHPKRLFKRKYNQSALLAIELAKNFNKEYLPLVLKRKKNTVSQGHLSRLKRQQNVRGAFYISSNEKIKGKKVLLIDDVYTTGATLNECSKVLKKAKAKEVMCLTLCRAGK